MENTEKVSKRLEKLTGQKFFDSSVTDGGPDGHDNEDDETRRPGHVYTQVFHLRKLADLVTGIDSDLAVTGIVYVWLMKSNNDETTFLLSWPTLRQKRRKSFLLRFFSFVSF